MKNFLMQHVEEATRVRGDDPVRLDLVFTQSEYDLPKIIFVEPIDTNRNQR